MTTRAEPIRKPDWLRVRVRSGEQREKLFSLLSSLSLHTVCEEANCPNLSECFCRGTATFMILGRQCTRNCTFCNVSHDAVEAPDPQEPAHVAEAVAVLGLRHAVVTSVTRDDLPDGGASQFEKTVRTIRERTPDVTVEVLIPDFRGNPEALKTVLSTRPDVLAHNVETVPRLYPAVRPMASYVQSLDLLRRVADYAAEFSGGELSGDQRRIRVKSGFMLGLGETESEVEALMSDLRATGCERLSIGQYLAPSPSHHPVIAYVTPEAFAQWEKAAYNLGFEHVASGPLVRSSWHAEEGLSSICGANRGLAGASAWTHPALASNPYPNVKEGLSTTLSLQS